MSHTKEDVSDTEIEADIFRLMRTGDYSTAASLQRVVYETWDDLPKERLNECLARLVRRIM